VPAVFGRSTTEETVTGTTEAMTGTDMMTAEARTIIDKAMMNQADIRILAGRRHRDTSVITNDCPD